MHQIIRIDDLLKHPGVMVADMASWAMNEEMSIKDVRLPCSRLDSTRLDSIHFISNNF